MLKILKLIFLFFNFFSLICKTIKRKSKNPILAKKKESKIFQYKQKSTKKEEKFHKKIGWTQYQFALPETLAVSFYIIRNWKTIREKVSERISTDLAATFWLSNCLFKPLKCKECHPVIQHYIEKYLTR